MADQRRVITRGFAALYGLIVLGFIAIGPGVFASDWVSSSDFHACIGISSSVIALIAAGACLVYYFGQHSRFYLIIGLGFLVCGGEDLLHGIVGFERLFTDSGKDFSRFIPGTYVAGRSVLAVMIVAAAVLEPLLGRSKRIRWEAGIFSAIALAVGVGITALAFVLPLPQFIYPNQTISRPVDFIVAVLYAVAFAFILRRFLLRRDLFTGSLLACILLNLGGQIYMSFSKQLFDIFFDVAHYAGFWSYCLPIAGITVEAFGRMRTAQQAEEGLRASQRKYKSLVSNIPGVTYRRALDADRTMLYMSAAIEPLTGYPASDFIGNAVRTYESVIHPEDSPGVHQAVNKSVAAGRDWEIEYRICHQDGSVRWAHDKGRGVVGDDGQASSLDGFILDITGRRQAERDAANRTAELEQSHRVAMNLMEDAQTAREGVDRLNVRLSNTADEIKKLMDAAIEGGDLTLRFDNKQLVHCWEVKQCGQKDCPSYGRLDNLRCWEVAGTFCRGEVQGKFAKKLKDCRKCEVFQAAHADPVIDLGETFNQMMAILQDRQTAVEASFAEAEGARESAEQARQQSAGALAHTRAILTSAPDAIITIDGGGIIREFNPAAERIFGYASEEISGRNVTTLMPSCLRQSHEHGLSGYVRTGERRILGQTVEVQGLRKDGAAFPLELTVDEIDGTERQLFTAICRDITDRKQAEEERIRLIGIEHERNKLQDAVAAQDQMLSVVGHELRTPLAALRATTEFLVTDEARETEEFGTFLRSINDEVVRMAGIVNDLLEAARLNSGRASWNWGSVHVATVCEKALDEIRPLVDLDRVKLEWEVEPEDLTMSGDSEAVRRLVLNFVDNSRKHTSRGSIRVSARAVELAEGTGVEIEIVDTGEGIDPEIADRLGTAFALNAGMAGSKYTKGTGLGISICRGIVAAHGGTVSIRSALGKGATVTVRLRADLPEAIRDAHDVKVEQEIAA